MSTPSPLDADSDDDQPQSTRDGTPLPWVRTPLAVLLFWGAIVLPVLYLPLIIAGIDSMEGVLVFLGLFGLHLVTLFGGRFHPGRFER